MGSLVSYQLLDGVATIVMDDGKVNALSSEMLASISEALDRSVADEAAVVLTGRAGVFSGGFDLKVLTAGGPDAARMLEDGFELALRLLEHPTPVVIASNGHTVAMGVFLLLSGDYRIGVDGPFQIVANEVAIGLTMPWAAIEICRQRLTPSHFHRVVNLSEVYTPSEGGCRRAPGSGRRRRRPASDRHRHGLGLRRPGPAGPHVDQVAGHGKRRSAPSGPGSRWTGRHFERLAAAAQR